jgi:2,3-bisphosphoglycerate-independent phosphoglycerate mutase
MSHKKVALVILDGWGIGQIPEADAIKQANTPFFDQLMSTCPNSTLKTFGENVGLPFGQMGNSEVGHLNIGAGRVVYQELLKINNAVTSGELENAVEMQQLFQYCITNNKPLHLMGLVSDGGVHSHSSHVVAICEFAHKAGVKDVFVHAFTDGRDTDPKSGNGFVKGLMEKISPFGAKVVSLCGRYYAMDRDKRWERVQLAYNMLVKGEGLQANDLLEALNNSYADGVTDEFVKPIVLANGFQTLKADDAVFVSISELIVVGRLPKYLRKRILKISACIRCRCIM